MEFEETYLIPNCYHAHENRDYLKKYYEHENSRYIIPKSDIEEVIKKLTPPDEVEIIENIDPFVFVSDTFLDLKSIGHLVLHQWIKDGRHFYLIRGGRVMIDRIDEAPTEVKDASEIEEKLIDI